MTVTVHTVTGDMRSDELGFTLPHEHLLKTVKPSDVIEDPIRTGLVGERVGPQLAWILRERPYACLDNMNLDDVGDAADELGLFRHLGGATVVEVTSAGLGRDRAGLAELSRQSGVAIVAGGGWYLEKYHPDATAYESVDALTERILADYAPEDGPTSGVIGEVGVSPSFTGREEKSLRAACRAWHQLRLPLYIHLPGFVRLALRVLDIVVDQESVSPSAVVMCHMDPSGSDTSYQKAVADRGTWLEFDMIGMPENYPYPGEGQSPAVEQTIGAIRALVDDGYGSRLLFSHDMFLKTMLRRTGGNGLAYVPGLFLDRLREAGVDDAVVTAVNTVNVQRLFEAAADEPPAGKGVHI